MVNAFLEDPSASRVRTRPLCAMLCAMHSLSGGVAAPRLTLRLDRFTVATQESRDGTIVALLAGPEADERALVMATRIVARGFSVASRRALASVLDADLLDAETRVLDETPNDETLEVFENFHARYLLSKVFRRTNATITERWLREIADVRDVRAAHAFVRLGKEETEEDSFSRLDEGSEDECSDEDGFDDRWCTESPVSAVSRTSSITKSPLADILSPASKSAAWRTVRRRAAEMMDQVLRSSKSASPLTLTETLAFERADETGEVLRATLHAFASEAHDANEGSETYRDAACAVAVSVSPEENRNAQDPKNQKAETLETKRDESSSISPSLASAFARARAAVLADLAPPPPEAFSPAARDASATSARVQYEYGGGGSPASPLSVAEFAALSGEESEDRGAESEVTAPVAARATVPPGASRGERRAARGTRVYPYEPSPARAARETSQGTKR